MLNRIKYLPLVFLFFTFAAAAYGGRFHGGYSHSVGHHGGYYHGGGHHSGCYPGWGYRGGCYRGSGCYPQRCYRGPCFAGYGGLCGFGLFIDNCYDYCDAPCEEVIEYRTVCGYEPCYGWRNGRYCCWERYVCRRVPVRRFVYY